MKLRITTRHGCKLKDAVPALGWTSASELWSASDDHSCNKLTLSMDGPEQILLLGEDVYPTAMDWFPGLQGGKKSASDFFAVSSTDGKFRFVSRGGRIDKTVEAHQGAVTSCRWSPDGAALVTVGEDGNTKIWSRSGMLRSCLERCEVPVYSAAWSPDSDRVVHTYGKQLIIKPLQPQAKTEQWKAHDGVVLQVDWNVLNGRIISGGEDRKYKVWDPYGQPLYSSEVHDHAIMAVRWAPDGLVFAVGSFNMLRLCDQAGWSQSLEKIKSGAVYSIAWTADSSRLAAGCANGEIQFGSVLEKKVTWKDYLVTLKTEDTIEVRELTGGSTSATELLTDFRDPVVKMSIAYGHLVVATPTQVFMYKTTNWHTPVTFDRKEGTLRYIMQTADHAMLMDNNNGIQIFSYEGRLLSSPKLSQWRVELLNDQLISTSTDMIAIRDQRDPKVVHILDIVSGAPIGKPVQHTNEVVCIKLDQCPKMLMRHLVMIDKNRDLHITALRRSRPKSAKLGTMVQSLIWHDEHSMLAAVTNGKVAVWYFPSAAFVDPDVLPQTRFDRDAAPFGKTPTITAFSGNSCTITRGDGAVMPVSVSPYPAMLHQYICNRSAESWNNAIRLCRFVKDPAIWACVAAMAASAKELYAAEIAYAAIEEVDKVQYISYIKTVPSPEGREAEMALFCHEFQEAEHILIQAGLFFRAIEMNCNNFRWQRALDLADKYKTHGDTVIWMRRQYLGRFPNSRETLPEFITADKGLEGKIDPETIELKVAAEIEKEKTRPGATPYLDPV